MDYEAPAPYHNLGIQMLESHAATHSAFSHHDASTGPKVEHLGHGGPGAGPAILDHETMQGAARSHTVAGAHNITVHRSGPLARTSPVYRVKSTLKAPSSADALSLAIRQAGIAPLAGVVEPKGVRLARGAKHTPQRFFDLAGPTRAQNKTGRNQCWRPLKEQMLNFWGMRGYAKSAHERDFCTPSYVNIGFPKCGSTSLWNYLQQHPQVRSAALQLRPGPARPGPALSRVEPTDHTALESPADLPSVSPPRASLAQ